MACALNLHRLRAGREALRDRHYFRIKNSVLRITSPGRLANATALWVGRRVQWVSALTLTLTLIHARTHTHNRSRDTRLRAACIDGVAEPCRRTLLGNTGWLYLRSTFPSVTPYRPRQTPRWSPSRSLC